MTFFYSQLSQPNFRNSLDVTIRKGENFLERFASLFHDRVDCEISIARRTRQRRTNCEGRKGIHVEIWESAMLISWMKMRCSGRWLRVFILEQ